MANYAAKFASKVAERFAAKSYTAGAGSNEYTFEGVRVVKVYSEDTYAFGDYSRTGAGNRYGTPHDQTDSLQELEMTQDKGVSIIIDKLENSEKMNTQGANRQLKREIDEQATPMFDKYTFKKWIAGAGNVVVVNAVPNANTSCDLVLDITEKIDDALCSEEGRTLFTPTSFYKNVKKDDQWVYTDKAFDGVVRKGVVGQLDNFTVRKIAGSSYFPNGVYAMGMHKSAALNPVKLRDYNLHKDPPGVSGDQIDIRLNYDAFVLDAKAGGICVVADANVVCAEPSITVDKTNEAVAITFVGDKAFYTLDGSDPRCSGSAVEINANTNVNTNGKSVEKVRVVAVDANKAVSFRSAEAAY